MLAQRFVIAVKQPHKILIELTVPGEKLFENERPRKTTPCAPGAISPGLLQTRLHHHVFRGKRGAQILGLLANGGKLAGEPGSRADYLTHESTILLCLENSFGHLFARED